MHAVVLRDFVQWGISFEGLLCCSARIACRVRISPTQGAAAGTRLAPVAPSHLVYVLFHSSVLDSRWV
jgi:hypothetical protein